MAVEQVTGPVVYHGEGPVWHPGWGGLRFVDMLAGDVMSLAADGSLERRHVGSVAAVVRPRRGGGAVIGVERGFALEDPDGTVTAGLTDRRTPDGGRPDGLTVDADGGVWTAVSNGGAVYRYGPDGVLEEKLAVPARTVTACTFGGEHLDQLFITTSQQDVDTRDDPLAGSLFRAGVGVAGLPVRVFAG